MSVFFLEDVCIFFALLAIGGKKGEISPLNNIAKKSTFTVS
jgi:hypothetical protein